MLVVPAVLGEVYLDFCAFLFRYSAACGRHDPLKLRDKSACYYAYLCALLPSPQVYVYDIMHDGF